MSEMAGGDSQTPDQKRTHEQPVSPAAAHREAHPSPPAGYSSRWPEPQPNHGGLGAEHGPDTPAMGSAYGWLSAESPLGKPPPREPTPTGELAPPPQPVMSTSAGPDPYDQSAAGQFDRPRADPYGPAAATLPADEVALLSAPLRITQQPPAPGTQQPPAPGTQQPPAPGTQQPPVNVAQPAPVNVAQQPPVTGMHQAPVTGTEAARNEPIHRAVPKGRVLIEDAVVEKVAGLASVEVPGVADLGGWVAPGSEAAREHAGTGQGGGMHGVRARIGDRQVWIHLVIVIEYGAVVMEVANAVQANVARAVSHMLGLRVIEVNVTVDDVEPPQHAKPIRAPNDPRDRP